MDSNSHECIFIPSIFGMRRCTHRLVTDSPPARTCCRTLSPLVFIRAAMHKSLFKLREFVVHLHNGTFPSAILYLLSSVAAVPRCVHLWFDWVVTAQFRSLGSRVTPARGCSGVGQGPHASCPYTGRMPPSCSRGRWCASNARAFSRIISSQRAISAWRCFND